MRGGKSLCSGADSAAPQKGHARFACMAALTHSLLIAAATADQTPSWLAPDSRQRTGPGGEAEARKLPRVLDRPQQTVVVGDASESRLTADSGADHERRNVPAAAHLAR